MHDFEELGGWMVDSQYVHIMGTPYLIAPGVGNPVPDAVKRVELSEGGSYRLWVRSRNWVVDHAPGQFQVLLNGQPTEAVFGKSGTDEWVWEPGGEFDLAAGPCELTMRDLTGYFARCASLILTTDGDYVPPSEVGALRDERRRMLGVPAEPEDMGDFDLVVVGAGPGGCPSAIAAARLGLKTALVHDRPIVGGNASGELGVAFDGASSRQANAREGGIAEEICRLRAMHKGRGYTDALQMLIDAEPNLHLFTNKRVMGAETGADQAIRSVEALDTFTGRKHVFRGRIFIDCTGDAWLGYFAGAEYMFGRESRDQFDESMAPEKADRISMSGCLMGPTYGPRGVAKDSPVPYVAPAWAPKFPPDEEFGRIVVAPKVTAWWLEHPGMVDDVWDGERARDELIKISFGFWDWIKNVWSGREKAANYVLAHQPIMNGRREGMRLIGDHVLTENDAEQARPFPDRVGHAGWPIDVHHPKGIFSGKEGPFQSNTHVPLHLIPFRSLYSRNVPNLMMAGRNISVTHVALGTVRVQNTIATMAQAVGTAAWLCVKHDTTPRGIYRNHLAELQQTLLKHDQYIPGLRSEDAADLARKAKARASSSKEDEKFNLRQGWETELMPLDTPRALLFPRGVEPRVDSIYLKLHSDLDQPVEATLHVRETPEPGDFLSRQDIATPTAIIPAKGEHWVEFKIDRDVEVRYLWVWLAPMAGISWRRVVRPPLDYFRATGGDEGPWETVYGQGHSFSPEEPSDVVANCGPENVINGYSRIQDPDNYMWVSDPVKGFPQWVDLDFGGGVEMNTVYLTFDTDMNNPPMPGGNLAGPRVRQCVKDYEVACKVDGEWRTVASVEGNFMRRCVHRFEAMQVEQLRVTVKGSNGDKSARVFEIRAYRE